MKARLAFLPCFVGADRANQMPMSKESNKTGGNGPVRKAGEAKALSQSSIIEHAFATLSEGP